LALFLFTWRINNKNKTEIMDNRIMSFDEFVAKDQPQVDAMPQMQPEIQPEMPVAQEQPMEEPMMPQAEPAMMPSMEQPAVEPEQGEEGLQMLEEPTV
jgi:hypothetical protein